MSLKIYQIPFEIRSLLESYQVNKNTGEIENFDQAKHEQVMGDAREKIANTARFIREQEAEIVAMKDAVSDINERIAQKQRNIAWLKRTSVNALLALGEKVEMPDIRVSTTARQVVEIEDENALPDIWFKVKTEKMPDKMLIKHALKNGEQVPGAMLIDNYSISIK